MTYSKDWRNYPPEFVTLVEAAALRIVEIPCASEKEALRLQNKLHAFFGTLHRNALKQPEVLALDNLSRQVRVKAEGAILRVGPRDTDPDNLLIRAALAAQPALAQAPVNMSPELAAMFAQTLTTGGE